MHKSTPLYLLLLFIFTVPALADVPRTMYVLNESAETLSAQNMQDLSIRQDIVNIGQSANQIVAHNDLLYIVNSGTDDIMVVDPQNDTVIKQTIALPEGSNPWAIGFTSAIKAYVTNYVANNIAVIDLQSGNVIKNIAVGQAPEGIVVRGNRAYITNTGYTGWGLPYDGSSVAIIDTDTDSVLTSLPIPDNAQDLAFGPDGRLFVLCTGDYAVSNGSVVVIDPGYDGNTPTVVDTIQFGWVIKDTTPFSPGDIVVSNFGKGYCLAWGDGTNGHLCSFDAVADTILRDADDPILIGPNTFQMLYDPETDDIWIPYMSEWGGDGFVQQFDPVADSVVWVSNVLGNGSKACAFVGPITNSGIESDADHTPLTFELGQNYPNPFNPTTTIPFTLARAGDVKLSIYNVTGQLVDVLMNGHLHACPYTSVWNGKNQSGNPVPSGMYYYRLESNGMKQTGKMLLVR